MEFWLTKRRLETGRLLLLSGLSQKRGLQSSASLLVVWLCGLVVGWLGCSNPQARGQSWGYFRSTEERNGHEELKARTGGNGQVYFRLLFRPAYPVKLFPCWEAINHVLQQIEMFSGIEAIAQVKGFRAKLHRLICNPGEGVVWPHRLPRSALASRTRLPRLGRFSSLPRSAY